MHKNTRTRICMTNRWRHFCMHEHSGENELNTLATPPSLSLFPTLPLLLPVTCEHLTTLSHSPSYPSPSLGGRDKLVWRVTRYKVPVCPLHQTSSLACPITRLWCYRVPSAHHNALHHSSHVVTWSFSNQSAAWKTTDSAFSHCHCQQAFNVSWPLY